MNAAVTAEVAADKKMTRRLVMQQKPGCRQLPFIIAAVIILASTISAAAASDTPNRLHGFGGGSSKSSLRVKRGAENETASYKAMCLLDRKPSVDDNPWMIFFSARGHSAATLGCHENIKFRLNVTTEMLDDPKKAELVQENQQIIKRHLIDSQFYDSSLTTYILVHGFMASWTSDTWMCTLKDVILNNTEANVFIVDWSGGAKPMLPIDYGAAVTNTAYVSQMIGIFVNTLLRVSGQNDASNFHLIGHSLGAHISGFVGYSLNGTTGRITALDPAGPCFGSLLNSGGDNDKHDSKGRLRRLSRESASTVVAIHTDVSLFGLNENCAHYDVYINGGARQPNCDAPSFTDRLSDFFQLDFASSFNFDIVCAHGYAHDIISGFMPVLDTYSSQPVSYQQSGRRPPVSKRPDAQCYAMAYECRSWEAFKAGECGMCEERDSRCVFVGLEFEQDPRWNQPESDKDDGSMLDGDDDDDDEYQDDGSSSSSSGGKKVAQQDDSSPDKGGDAKVEEEGDVKFNGEDDRQLESTNESEVQKVVSRLAQPRVTSSRLFGSTQASRRRHFVKSSAEDPFCLYHYQLVIAARKANGDESRTKGRSKFYLQMPLISPRAHESNETNTRIVQVSHALQSDSSSFSQLSGAFVDELNQLYALPASQTFSQANRTAELYTALVTFAWQPPEEDCSHGGGGANENGTWFLCQPMRKLFGAQLWSASRAQLGQVEWVAVNYMSGLDHTARLRYSQLLVPDARTGVQSREESSSESSSSGQSSINGVRGSSGSRGSSSNIDKELKYRVELRPIKRRVTD